MKLVPYSVMGFLISYLLSLAGIPFFSSKGILINLVAFAIMLWTEY